jgi:hypothetical protein
MFDPGSDSDVDFLISAADYVHDPDAALHVLN